MLLPAAALAVAVCPVNLNKANTYDVPAYSLRAQASTNAATGKVRVDAIGYDSTETYFVECWGERLDGTTNIFCSGFFQGQPAPLGSTPETDPNGCVYRRIGCGVQAYSPRTSAKFTGQWYHSP